MTFQDVSEKLQHGGTFLFTARSSEFAKDEGKRKAAAISAHGNLMSRAGGLSPPLLC